MAAVCTCDRHEVFHPYLYASRQPEVRPATPPPPKGRAAAEAVITCDQDAVKPSVSDAPRVESSAGVWNSPPPAVTACDQDEGIRSVSDAPPTHYIVKLQPFSLLTKNNIEKYISADFEAGGYKWCYAAPYFCNI